MLRFRGPGAPDSPEEKDMEDADRQARTPGRWGWLFPALWCLLIAMASSIPDITTPRGIFAPDKLIHVAEYGILSALLAVALAERVRWPVGRRVALAVGLCLVFGALDEIYQMRMSGRASDAFDFLSDAVGSLAGQSVLWVGRIRRGRP